MKADLKVHFYLRKTDEKKNGECPVIGKITIGRDVAQFSAKITAKASLWDIVSGRVKGKSKHAPEVNSTLDKMAVSISTTYRKLQDKNQRNRYQFEKYFSRHRIRTGNTNQVLHTS